MPRGKYIVVEGLDGTGKTTQLTKMQEYFGAKNTLAVREPGGTPMAEQIRSILKDKNLPRSAKTNMFLFSAARADLLDNSIRPALTSGKNVVCDRNWLSTIAYQAAEGADVSDILTLSKIAAGDLFEPDLIILIDLDPAICRQRLFGRGGSEVDYFDSKGQDYFLRVRQAYLEEIKKLKNAIVVDGAPAPDKVWQQIEEKIKGANL